MSRNRRNVLLCLAGVVFLGTYVGSEGIKYPLSQSGPLPAALQQTSASEKASPTVGNQGQPTTLPSVHIIQSSRGAGAEDIQQQQHQEQPAQQQQCSPTHISQIKCWLDADGYIAGLAFETETGISAPALCQADGLVTDGGMLDKGEAIVEIISCRGPTGGIWWLEFHTNKRRKSPLTCGIGGFMQQNPQGSDAAGAGQCIGLTQVQHASVSTANVDATKRRASKPAPLPADAFPVAGLVGKCNRHQQISSFSNTCWNRNSTREQPAAPSRPVESSNGLDPVS